MHVAICIVGFRNSGDIVQCLKALERSTYENFEVIICENGGEIAFADLAAAIPSTLPIGQSVRAVLAPRNLGYAGGVNTCLRETEHADAWWILNPDTQPEPRALTAQVQRLAKGDCQAVGCTLYLDNGLVQSHGGQWRPWLARPVSIGYGSSLHERPDPISIERTQSYLNGASMLVSRRFLEATGFMKEEYFLYCEEVEWCLRAKRRGMRLGFAADAMVFHAHGTTTGSGEHLARQPRTPIYLNERNKMLVTRDCYPMRVPIAAIAVFGHLFLRYIRRGAFRQFFYGLSGWAAGLIDLRGKPTWLST